MAEYIERESAMLLPELPKEYRNYQTDNLDDAYEQGWYDALCCLEYIPADDVAPVVHGRWEWDTEDIYRCSNCAEKSHVKEVMGRPAWGYCPKCGARMDGGSD